MKSLFRSVYCALALFASPSIAADLPSLKQAPLLDPTPAANWAGFYLGASGGANVALLTGGALAFGGLRGGYNWQFNHVVVGVQAETNWRPDAHSAVTNWNDGAGTQYQANHGFTANFISTLTTRLGYEVAERFLPFIFGGLALSEGGLWTTATGLSGPNAGASGANSLDQMRVGWTLGGGLEYRLTSNWSVEAQYAYFSFPQRMVLLTPISLGGTQVNSFTLSNRGFGSLISLGANYRF